MRTYYNEFDPFASAWLRELIAQGVIPDGEVDTRSIADVRPADLTGFTQCHFFAGIGGWAYALRLAGWPDDRPVWTGSCPCQPFSTAGAQAGGDDPRHLWPTWGGLIRECRPSVVFGEQVAAAIGHGWLDLVCADLEAADYAVGALVAGAHSVGAPHIRQRLWLVADNARGGLGVDGRAPWPTGHADERRATGGGGSAAGGDERGILAPATTSTDRVGADRLADNHGAGRGQQRRAGLPHDERPAQRHDTDGCGADGGAGFWDACDWLPCSDGKARPVEPGTFPLAHGVSQRVGRLRGYGNAIVPQVAAEVIAAYLEIRR